MQDILFHRLDSTSARWCGKDQHLSSVRKVEQCLDSDFFLHCGDSVAKGKRPNRVLSFALIHLINTAVLTFRTAR